MSAKFLDTNILVYFASGEATKAEIAERLLAERPIVSAQVLNELVDVSRRKLRFSWDEIEELMTVVLTLTKAVPLTVETNTSARAIAARYHLPFYDALIVAAAIEGGCAVLITEDFHHGQRIGNLTITNPFR